MKKLSYILLFLIIFCLPSLAFGADYCVTQDGTGTCGAVNATHTQAQFEALSSDYHGDTFYFSGTFSSKVDVRVYGTSAGQVVLDGYQAGTCDPINATCSSSALLNDGMNVHGGIDYVTVKDFRITGSSLSINTAGAVGVSDYVIIENNDIYETEGSLFSFAHDSNYDGSSYVIVRNNRMAYCGQNGTNPAQCINIVSVTNGLFLGNLFKHQDSDHPSGCTSAELMELHRNHQLLIEYNDFDGAPNQSLLRPKEGSTQTDIIVRFNKMHDNKSDADGTTQGYGIHSYGAVISPLYIYGNFIYNNLGIAIRLDPDTPSTSYVWSNLFVNNGITDAPPNGRGGIQTKAGTIYVYNNTFSRNGQMDNVDYPGTTAVLIGDATSYIKNNLFYNNLPGGDYSFYHSVSESGTATFELEHNTYYHASSTDHFYYNGAKRNLAYMNGEGYEQDAPIGMVEDPTFTNPDGTDTTHGTDDDIYTLQSGSPSINDGVDLSECFYINLSAGDSWFETQSGYSTITVCYDDALDPSAVDWTGDAKDLADNAGNFTVKRDTYGWSRGAYAYGVGGGDTTAPTPNPATFSSDPAGASTTSIDMTATTGSDVNTISILFDFDPDSDSCGSHADIGTGGSDRTWTEEDYTHTDDGLQVNQYYCYKCQLRDSIPNTGTASSLAGAYSLAAVPGTSTLSAGTDPNTQISFDALDENGNPTATPDTYFACQVTDSSPYDSTWHGKYIDPDDATTPSDTAVWKTNSDWDGLGDVDGFNSNTTFKIACKARNGDNTETALGTEAEITTDYPPGSGENETAKDIHITNLKLE